MRGWCQNCGNYRTIKEHDKVFLCPACVKKIRKEKPNVSNIKNKPF